MPPIPAIMDESVINCFISLRYALVGNSSSTVPKQTPITNPIKASTLLFDLAIVVNNDVQKVAYPIDVVK